MFHVEQSLRFRTICQTNGLTPADQQIELLRKYVTLLTDWNEKVNLVSRADVQNIWFSHILHSLTPLFYVELPVDCHLLDLGSGGGLPGIPLAILRPDMKVTLLDSIQKKTGAVSDILFKLGLPNCTVATGRAEEVIRDPAFANRFDGVIARGVAPLVDLVKWSRPFLRVGETRPDDGEESPVRHRTCRIPFLIALKGGDLEAEIRKAEIKQRGDRTTTVIDIRFEGSGEMGLTEKKIVLVEFRLS